MRLRAAVIDFLRVQILEYFYSSFEAPVLLENRLGDDFDSHQDQGNAVPGSRARADKV